MVTELLCLKQYYNRLLVISSLFSFPHCQDDIRIAKMIQPDPDKVKFGGLIPSWHHVDCFLDNLDSLEAEGVAPEELSGFIKLDKDGKDELKKKFKAKLGKPKKGWVMETGLKSCLC